MYNLSPTRLADLLSRYPHTGNRNLAAEFGLKEQQVVHLAKCLKVKKSPVLRSQLAGKIQWTTEEDAFLLKNWKTMTNRALAEALGIKLTSTRTRLYELGLRRMEMEYWNEEQVQFLIENYKVMGDTEIAELFSKKWLKNKGWSKKHIEKKRRYLKLKRTKKEIKNIHGRNIKLGLFKICPIRAWDKRGRANEGTIRYWAQGGSQRLVAMIKVNGSFVHYARYRFEQLNGQVKKGYNVIFLDNNPENLADNNLGLVSNEELALINNASVKLTDNYVAAIMTMKHPELRAEIKKYPEIIAIKRLQLQLNRAINENI